MTATAILQAYLDRMGAALMDERFEDYAAGVKLPLTILTSAAALTVATIDDLQDGLDDFIEMIHSRGVTSLLRTVRVADRFQPDQIVGIYEARLMAGSQLAMPTFHSKMWLCRCDGVWKATRIHNTTREARWPMVLSRLSDEFWLPQDC
jgi:hypothetical protein